MALSIDFRGSVSFPPGYPSYRTLTFVLVGLTPTEYTSLRWTYADSFSFPMLRVIPLASAHLMTEQGVDRGVSVQRNGLQTHMSGLPDPLP